MQAWLKNRAPGEKTVFSDLFKRTFVPVYSWGTQNLHLLMPVLQCNIVRQMLCILEGLVPVKNDDEQAVSVSSKDSQEGKRNISKKFIINLISSSIPRDYLESHYV